MSPENIKLVAKVAGAMQRAKPVPSLGGNWNARHEWDAVVRETAFALAEFCDPALFVRAVGGFSMNPIDHEAFDLARRAAK